MCAKYHGDEFDLKNIDEMSRMEDGKDIKGGSERKNHEHDT